MFNFIVFRLGCDSPPGLLLFVPAVLFTILTPLFCVSSSVSLSCFILAVPMSECLGKHSCMSSPFPIAILNGTSSFLSLVQENINMPRDTIIGFVPEVAVKNHLIKKSVKNIFRLFQQNDSTIFYNSLKWFTKDIQYPKFIFIHILLFISPSSRSTFLLVMTTKVYRLGGETDSAIS